MSTAVKKPKWPYKHVTSMYAHRNGQWAKRINGKTIYFGTWDNPDAALAEWRESEEWLYSANGSREVTVDEIFNRWLTDQQSRVGAKKNAITTRTFQTYKETARSMLQHLGRATTVRQLYEEPSRWTRVMRKLENQFDSPYPISRHVKYTRAAFKWAYEERYIEKPMLWGSAFKPPSQADIDKYRLQQAERDGNKLYSAAEIQALLAVADPGTAVLILLGINGGYGDTDCAELLIEDIDFEQSRIAKLRHKTSVPRCVPLWPETISALRAVIGSRVSGHAILTRYGNKIISEWTVRTGERAGDKCWTNGVYRRFKRACDVASVRSRGFYALRHTFRSVAFQRGSSPPMIDLIMGHRSGSIGDRLYTHGDYPMDELWSVSHRVRTWLYGETKT